MLIPHEGNKWSWDDGPVCDSKEAALEHAKVTVVKDAQVVLFDAVEKMELVEEGE